MKPVDEKSHLGEQLELPFADGYNEELPAMPGPRTWMSERPLPCESADVTLDEGKWELIEEHDGSEWVSVAL